MYVLQSTRRAVIAGRIDPMGGSLFARHVADRPLRRHSGVDTSS